MEFIEFVGMAATFALTIVGGYTGIRLVNVWARRLTRNERDENVAADLEELRARVQELESVRMTELEERVDFTERLLAQAQEMPHLPAPGRLEN